MNFNEYEKLVNEEQKNIDSVTENANLCDKMCRVCHEIMINFTNIPNIYIVPYFKIDVANKKLIIGYGSFGLHGHRVRFMDEIFFILNKYFLYNYDISINDNDPILRHERECTVIEVSIRKLI